MTQASSVLQMNLPQLDVVDQTCVLKGDWVIAAIDDKKQLHQLKQALVQASGKVSGWDLRQSRLDHIGAQVLWQCWQGQMPGNTALTPDQNDLFERIRRFAHEPQALAPQVQENGFLDGLGYGFFRMLEHFVAFVQLIGQFVLDLGRLLKAPAKAPWRDFSGQLLRMGAQALPIVGLVSVLCGVVIVYLLAGFLRSYGLELYIINMIGLIGIRELGPLMAAILIAGRSGSTITAQIGVMRLREELDAMHVLGISETFRLILPRVLALALAMPLISMWAALMIILGGMVVASISVDISFPYFLQTLPTAVSINNIWVCLSKSVVFGIFIALIGGYCGLRVKSDTESLGNGTTASVVASISVVIVADAVFAILYRNVPV